MHAHHSAIIRKEPRSTIGRLQAECDRLRDHLKAQWSERKGLVEARGSLDWRRLFGRRAPRDDVCFCPGLPGDDHVSMWRKKGGHPGEIAVWVSQPYPLGGRSLREMNQFAILNNLEFSIGVWPAWHYPGAVLFVEWTARQP
jgi:hypothetical protein